MCWVYIKYTTQVLKPSPLITILPYWQQTLQQVCSDAYFWTQSTLVVTASRGAWLLRMMTKDGSTC